MIDFPRRPLAAVLFAGTVAVMPALSPAQPSGPQSAGSAPTQDRARGSHLASQRIEDGREAAATVLASLDKLFKFAGSDERPNKLQTAAFLDREIAPYFDFDYMTAFVAGPALQELTPEQRKALAAQLESRILSGVAERLLMPPGQSVRYVRPRSGERESVDVRIGLSPPLHWRGGPRRPQPPLVFRMYRSEDGWKAFDVLADGRSVIAAYRDTFKDQVGEPSPAAPTGR